jgi:hypothetical protein
MGTGMNRWSISALLIALVASACTVQPSSPGGEGGGAQDDGWGSHADVQEILQNACSTCHGSGWSSCWGVHDDASTLEEMIASGAMPRGQPMAPVDKATVLAWLQDGAACVGTEPDAGQSPLMSGAPTP